MKDRELKIPSGEAKAIGDRLEKSLRYARQGHPEKQDRQWLAAELGISTAMISRMINHGHGSFAGWRAACNAVKADMQYVAFGLGPTHRGDAEFSHFLAANQELVKELKSMKAERDRLLDQITKLRLVKP